MDTNLDNIRFPGDVVIEKIELKGLNGQTANIKMQVESIEIYEDMFTPFTTVSIVMRESIDYINLFPFCGEEYVNLIIKTPSMDQKIKGEFFIYKIADRMYTKDKEVVYTLKGISSEWLIDSNRKLSKTYKGRPDEIARRLISDDGLLTQKKYNIEKSGNDVAFTACYWTPVKCLNYLTTITKNQNGSATYLFFENREGYNFRSINELLQKNTYTTFHKDNYTRDFNAADGSNHINMLKEYNRILSFDSPVVTDYMKDVQSGRLKSRLISHDIVTKMYHIKDYNVSKETTNALLNKYSNFSKYALTNPMSKLILKNRHYSTYDNYPDITSYGYNQDRISFFNNLEQYKSIIEVYGRTDYSVGHVVELSIPKATVNDKTSNDRDGVLSGRYLVSAISHKINHDKHTCHIEVIKNSLVEDVLTK